MRTMLMMALVLFAVVGAAVAPTASAAAVLGCKITIDGGGIDGDPKDPDVIFPDVWIDC